LTCVPVTSVGEGDSWFFPFCENVFVPGESRYLTSSFSGSYTLFICTGGGHVSFRVVNVTWIDLHPLAFILHFLNQFWIASRSVCSFCEAMAGSLSVASTAVSSAKVAVVDSGEVGWSAVYIRYNNDPRTLPWYACVDWGQFCELGFNLY
jgi:hypothetical protein